MVYHFDYHLLQTPFQCHMSLLVSVPFQSSAKLLVIDDDGTLAGAVYQDQFVLLVCSLNFAPLGIFLPFDARFF